MAFFPSHTIPRICLHRSERTPDGAGGGKRQAIIPPQPPSTKEGLKAAGGNNNCCQAMSRHIRKYGMKLLTDLKVVNLDHVLDGLMDQAEVAEGRESVMQSDILHELKYILLIKNTSRRYHKFDRKVPFISRVHLRRFDRILGFKLRFLQRCRRPSDTDGQYQSQPEKYKYM